jgi:Nucleotidyl transferase AbiEii toxin, Type IV TA system
MKLFHNLKLATSELKQWPGCWAICGGIAACIYRTTPRFTGDIDIAIIDHKTLSATEIANIVITKLGNKPLAGFVTDQHGALIQKQALVIGRENTDGSYVGIDFLLPVHPWIEEGVIRAQGNCFDYGFDKVPTLSAEDLILAKLFAFQGNPERKNDLDDLISIVRDVPKLDKVYLKERFKRYQLKVPEIVGSF